MRVAVAGGGPGGLFAATPTADPGVGVVTAQAGPGLLHASPARGCSPSTLS
jgi:predicted flavoprotein YhiN